MSARKGTISVNTADIFPIIKKWLYSEHDIFIRELVANATDAITKRASLARTRNEEIPTGSIDISVNKTNKTIKIKDNGLGMSEADVEKYIAQLAFSGAEEFVQKMKDNEKAGDIIGKFGLGFYSSFMVAEKVEIESLSMDKDSKATKWTCLGDTDYTFDSSNRSEVGTEITLYINEESEEFLNHFKISETLKKFCRYMPYEIRVCDEERKAEKPKKEDGSVDEEKEAVLPEPTLINNTTPLWKRDPKELKDEDYLNFYREQYPMDPEPLFWLHLKVDHPFTLEGILFFPKVSKYTPFKESQIHLYCKQVFVSDNVKNIIPDFLSLLRGCIDSVDIPLNVSRSSLQGDPNVRRISNYVVKKVAESLKALFKKDREKFEKIWEDSAVFVKYGIVSDTKFDELVRDYVIFKNTDDAYLTFDEYISKIPEQYAEKLKDKVLYFEKDKADSSLLKKLQDEGIPAIETDDHIDPHFMQHVEMKKVNDKEVKFESVDSAISDILTTSATDESDIKIKDLFIKYLKPATTESKTEGLDNSPEVEIVKIQGSTTPAYFKVDEQMKRFGQMTKSMGQTNSFPVKKTLMINPQNPLIQNAFKLHEKGRDDLVEKICHHVEDLAYISSEGLDKEHKDKFVQRSQDLIQELSSLAL